MSKIKVTFVETNCKKNGPIKQTLNIIRNMDKEVFEPSLVTVWPEDADNSMIDEYKKLGIPVLSANMSKKKSVLFGKKEVANIGLRKKVIMSERADPRAQFNNLPWKDKIGNFFMRKCGLFSLADWMVFQTPDAQSYYSEKIQKKSSIIPNPLDIDKLPERYDGEREKRIVAAGRFSEEKNFSLLIDGFATFHESFPDYTLTIYGEGALRKDYEMQIQELGLGGSVKLPGFASNLPEEINKAAMYISTSNHEGISNSMLEALGMGIPTIVTDCPVGGSKMFVHTGDNGVLIQMENKNDLVSAMTLIATNSRYVKHISNNAIKIREQLAAPNICQKWLQLL